MSRNAILRTYVFNTNVDEDFVDILRIFLSGTTIYWYHPALDEPREFASSFAVQVASSATGSPAARNLDVGHFCDHRTDCVLRRPDLQLCYWMAESGFDRQIWVSMGRIDDLGVGFRLMETVRQVGLGSLSNTLLSAENDLDGVLRLPSSELVYCMADYRLVSTLSVRR